MVPKKMPGTKREDLAPIFGKFTAKSFTVVGFTKYYWAEEIKTNEVVRGIWKVWVNGQIHIRFGWGNLK
jgi:hypothetical protein